MSEEIASKPKKSHARLKWVESRNFWTFFISTTFASSYFIWVVNKCHNYAENTFDHISSNMHFETWGNTVALFWGVFVVNGILKNVFPIRGRGRRDDDQEAEV